jgi:uncharacterized protein YndB with AHSA1/START domain
MELRFEVYLPARREEVAEVLLTPEEAPKWQRGLKRMEVVKGGPNEVGSLARLHFEEGGREYVMLDELLECRPGHEWKSRVSGEGMTVHVTTSLRPAEGGTTLRMTWSGKPDIRWARWIFPLFRPRVRNRIKSDLDSLTRLVGSRL